MKTTTDYLIEGRAKVARGWCQGAFRKDHPEYPGEKLYCAVGACENPDVQEYLQRSLPDPSVHLSAYNDSQATTQADIVAVYDRALTLALADQSA